MAAAFLVGLLLTAALVAGIAWVAVAVEKGWALAIFVVGTLLGGVKASYSKPRDPDWDDPKVRRRRWLAGSGRMRKSPPSGGA